MNNNVKLVSKFCSVDETRYHLKFCYHYEPLEALVATDGHKAIIDKSNYHKDAKAFRGDIYLKHNEFYYDETVKCPNIVNTIPDRSKVRRLVTDLELGDWVGKKLSKKPIQVYFDRFGQFYLSKPRRPAICLDLRLLSPLAGQTVSIDYKDNVSPLLITVKDNKDIEILIMPMRL